MDRASSDKSDPPCFKQDQTALVLSSALRFCSDRIAITRSEVIAISHSELTTILDRHRLGITDRAHPGTMIFISSEWQFSWLGIRMRHKSPDTTAHYAKVDIAALQEIAQPWPEESRSC